MNCVPSTQPKSPASVILATLLAVLWLIRPALSESWAGPSDATLHVNDTTDCAIIPLEVLKRLHAAAVDRTFMSADPPYADIELQAEFNGGRKIRRKIVDDATAFEISDTQFEVMSDQPAWDIVWNALGATESEHRPEPLELKLDLDDPVTSTTTTTTPFHKRNGFRGHRAGSRLPWRCDSQHDWIQLPIDFHPRFLRIAQCTRRTCWLHGNYECSPKRMSVQLLQRHIDGGCVDAANLKQYGFGAAMAESWRWVQADVSVYCECARRKTYSGFPY